MPSYHQAVLSRPAINSSRPTHVPTQISTSANQLFVAPEAKRLQNPGPPNVTIRPVMLPNVSPAAISSATEQNVLQNHPQGNASVNPQYSTMHQNRTTNPALFHNMPLTQNQQQLSHLSNPIMTGNQQQHQRSYGLQNIVQSINTFHLQNPAASASSQQPQSLLPHSVASTGYLQGQQHPVQIVLPSDGTQQLLPDNNNSLLMSELLNPRINARQNQNYTEATSQRNVAQSGGQEGCRSNNKIVVTQANQSPPAHANLAPLTPIPQHSPLDSRHWPMPNASHCIQTHQTSVPHISTASNQSTLTPHTSLGPLQPQMSVNQKSRQNKTHSDQRFSASTPYTSPVGQLAELLKSNDKGSSTKPPRISPAGQHQPQAAELLKSKNKGPTQVPRISPAGQQQPQASELQKSKNTSRGPCAQVPRISPAGAGQQPQVTEVQKSLHYTGPFAQNHRPLAPNLVPPHSQTIELQQNTSHCSQQALNLAAPRPHFRPMVTINTPLPLQRTASVITAVSTIPTNKSSQSMVQIPQENRSAKAMPVVPTNVDRQPMHRAISDNVATPATQTANRNSKPEKVVPNSTYPPRQDMKDMVSPILALFLGLLDLLYTELF